MKFLTSNDVRPLQFSNIEDIVVAFEVSNPLNMRCLKSVELLKTLSKFGLQYVEQETVSVLSSNPAKPLTLHPLISALKNNDDTVYG